MAATTTAASIMPSDPTSSKSASAAESSVAGNLLQTGSGLQAQGQTAIQPVLDHLTKLLSGNPTDVNQATQPQVASVLKQYDTARRTNAEFAPRGGGTTSANNTGRAQEASDIATTKNTAINNASTTLGQLATTLTGMGIQASEAGLQGFSDLVKSALAGEAQSSSNWSAIGHGIGMIASIALAAPTGGASLLALPALAKG